MENEIVSAPATDPAVPTSRLAAGAAVTLGILLLAVDFTTKALADARLPLDQLLPTAVPFFSFRLTYNTGSHYLFGAIGDWLPYRAVMGVAAVAVVGMVVFIGRDLRRMGPGRVRTVYWLMIATLIGAMGNAIEVVLTGRATDWFMIHPFPWPANLADQFVNATVFVLLPLSLLFGWRDAGPAPITGSE